MTTYDIPASLAARLPERSVRRFRSYSPISMPRALWERSRLDLLNLMADTEPPNDADARKVMGVICAFYAWAVDRFGEESVAALFTEARVYEFDTARVGTASEGTRSNDRGRLHRCLRALRGEPPVTRRSARGDSAAPYGRDEIAALVQAASTCDRLAPVLAVGLVTGKTAAGCAGEAVPDLLTLGGALQWLDIPRAPGLAATLDGVGALRSGAWQSARDAAQMAGLELDAKRLHMTWVATVATEPRAVGDLVALGLSRRDLDKALTHARPTTSEERRALLRG